MSQRFLVLEWSLLRGMVAMIILLCDVLRSLNFLSLYLQDPHIRITSVDNRVIVLINELTELIPLLENLDGTTYFSTLLTFLSKFLTMLNCKEEWKIKGIMLILSKFVGLWDFFFYLQSIWRSVTCIYYFTCFEQFPALGARDLSDQVHELGNHGLVMEI